MKTKTSKTTSRIASLWSKKIIRITVYILAAIILLIATAKWWNPIVFPPVKDPKIGVSFSQKRALELGLDWKANFTALLDDLDIKHYRLMSYWDIHEPVRGQMDFSSLDWQISEATKRGADVTLSIGIRQPRWPECHQPSWADALSGNEWKQALYAYMQQVVKRYENNPTVINWQLENEAVNEWFGECDPPDRVRLREEYNLVREWSDKPIWMSLSDQHGLPLNVPVADKFGYSVYRTVWSDKTWPYIGYITYPTPIWYHKLRAVAINATVHRDIFIHELQLEPWGRVDTKLLSSEEQDKSMSAEKIKDNLLFAREIGAKEIYTWGGEWWYWRKVNGDPHIWDTVKTEFKDAQSN